MPPTFSPPTSNSPKTNPSPIPPTSARIQLDPTNNRYWIAPTSHPSSPISSPLDGQLYLNDFTTGRSAEFAGITISAVNFANHATILQFDAYGRPVGQISNPTIRLAAGGSTLTVTINATTGETSITSP